MSRRASILIAGDLGAGKGRSGQASIFAPADLIEARGILSVSVAGHPEGHPYLSAANAFKRLKPVAGLGQLTKSASTS